MQSFAGNWGFLPASQIALQMRLFLYRVTAFPKDNVTGGVRAVESFAAIDCQRSFSASQTVTRSKGQQDTSLSETSPQQAGRSNLPKS